MHKNYKWVKRAHQILEWSKHRSEVSAPYRKTCRRTPGAGLSLSVVNIRLCIYSTYHHVYSEIDRNPRQCFRKHCNTLCSTKGLKIHPNHQNKKPSFSRPSVSGRLVCCCSSLFFISQQLKHTKQQPMKSSKHPIWKNPDNHAELCFGLLL